MGETPFTLTYGSEAVVPVEVGMPTYKVQHFNQSANDEKLEEQTNLLEEKREEAEIQMVIKKISFEH